jgi:hypothetical protein
MRPRASATRGRSASPSVVTSASNAPEAIAVYQQSSVARDVLVDVLSALGADAVPIGRSEMRPARMSGARTSR